MRHVLSPRRQLALDLVNLGLVALDEGGEFVARHLRERLLL